MAPHLTPPHTTMTVPSSYPHPLPRVSLHTWQRWRLVLDLSHANAIESTCSPKTVLSPQHMHPNDNDHPTLIPSRYFATLAPIPTLRHWAVLQIPHHPSCATSPSPCPPLYAVSPTLACALSCPLNTCGYLASPPFHASLCHLILTPTFSSCCLAHPGMCTVLLSQHLWILSFSSFLCCLVPPCPHPLLLFVLSQQSCLPWHVRLSHVACTPFV